MSGENAPITSEDKQAMIDSMMDLHNEIAKEIEKEQIDPGLMLRLLGAGMNQSLVALGVLLAE
jgi:hypothetical protein